MTSTLCHPGIESDHSPKSIARAAAVVGPLGRLLSGLVVAALVAFLAWSAISGPATLSPQAGVTGGAEAPLDGRGKWSGYVE